jgi:hypothetical protein
MGSDFRHPPPRCLCFNPLSFIRDEFAKPGIKLISDAFDTMREIELLHRAELFRYVDDTVIDDAGRHAQESGHLEVVPLQAGN